MQRMKLPRKAALAALFLAVLALALFFAYLALEFTRPPFYMELRVIFAPADTHRAYSEDRSLPLPPRTAFSYRFSDDGAVYYTKRGYEEFMDFYADAGYRVVGGVVFTDEGNFKISGNGSGVGSSYVRVAACEDLAHLLDRVDRHYELTGRTDEPNVCALPLGGRAAVYEELFSGIHDLDEYMGEYWAIDAPAVENGRTNTCSLFLVVGETSPEYVIMRAHSGALTLWRYREILLEPTDVERGAFPDASFAPLAEGEAEALLRGEGERG